MDENDIKKAARLAQKYGSTPNYIGFPWMAFIELAVSNGWTQEEAEKFVAENIDDRGWIWIGT